MPALTNKYDLPKSLVNAASKFKYSKGAAEYSVTTLIDSPRIALLKARHESELTEDISDNMFRLLGSALHLLVEKNADETEQSEERLFTTVDGTTISGGVDIQHEAGGQTIIGDYKVTSAYAVMSGKPEWENQLNCYAYLVEKEKGIKPTALYIYAVIRDWTARKLSENNYPVAPVVKIPINLWTFEKRESYIRRRVAAHKMADEDTQCTDADRWLTPTKWAVIKGGQKRALRVLQTPEEAADVCKKNPGSRIERREGNAIRCSGNYCSVAGHCSQWRRYQESSGSHAEGNGIDFFGGEAGS